MPPPCLFGVDMENVTYTFYSICFQILITFVMQVRFYTCVGIIVIGRW